MSEKKERIAFFDTKPYDRVWFDQLNRHYHIKYYEHKLTPYSVSLFFGLYLNSENHGSKKR